MPPKAPKELVEMFENVDLGHFDLETYRPDIRMRGWTDDEITLAYNEALASGDSSSSARLDTSTPPTPAPPTAKQTPAQAPTQTPTPPTSSAPSPTPTPTTPTSPTPPAPEKQPLNASTSIPTPGMQFLDVPEKPSLPTKKIIAIAGVALVLFALGYFLGFLFDL